VLVMTPTMRTSAWRALMASVVTSLIERFAYVVRGHSA
jgi:hypothetical protein